MGRKAAFMTARPWVDDPLFWTQVMGTLYEKKLLERENSMLKMFILSCGVKLSDAVAAGKEMIMQCSKCGYVCTPLTHEDGDYWACERCNHQEKVAPEDEERFRLADRMHNDVECQMMADGDYDEENELDDSA